MALMEDSGYNSVESAPEVIDVSDSEDDTNHGLTGPVDISVKPGVKRKDFDTIINEVTPKSKNGMILKIRKKEDGQFTILTNSCDQTQKIECKNHLQGCPKVDSAYCVKKHQLTCTFPPLRVTENLIRTKGVLVRKLSLNREKLAKFVPFCNSFIHHSGTQFLFKTFPTHLSIQTYSSQAEGKRFRLILTSLEDRAWGRDVQGCLGDMGHTLRQVGKEKMFQFQILLYLQDVY
jgi:hypothetical protein